MAASHRVRALAAHAAALALAVTMGAFAPAPTPARAAAPPGAAQQHTSNQAVPPEVTVEPATPSASQPTTTGKEEAGRKAPAKAAVRTAPARPGVPTATRRGNEITVKWAAPRDNGGTITGYVITPYRDGRRGKPITVAGDTTTHKLAKVAAKGTYTFTVAARNAAGTGPASRRSDPPTILAVPSAPTIIAVTVSNTTAILSWTPGSDGGSPITNYIVTPYIGGVAQPAQTFGPSTTNTVVGLTPTVTYTFTVRARNADGLGPESAPSETRQAGRSPFLTFVGGQPAVGVAYSATVNVANGVPPSTWSIDAGVLPPGLTLDPSTGIISGVPTAGGIYSFVVRVVGGGLAGTLLVTLDVTPAPRLVFVAPPLGEVGPPYSTVFLVTGGTGPFTWSIASGSLPPGLTLDPATGQLAGRPTTAGTYGFDVRVTDASGLADEAPTQVVVQPTSVVTLAAASSATTFATPITFGVDIGPGRAAGTVTLFDEQPTGVVLELGRFPVVFNRAEFEVQLPAFGTNRLRVQYDSSNTNAVVFSNTVTVEVSALAGQVLIEQFRQSGIAGLRDEYVTLYNNTPIPVQLARIRVEAPGGISITIPDTVLPINPGVVFLIAAPDYSLPGTAADLVVPDLGRDGLRVIAPDAGSTVLDAAGSTPGYATGTPLPAFTSPPLVRNAWVRLIVGGKPRDTRNNVADFRLVATVSGPINGVPSALGTPSPRNREGGIQRNTVLQTTLLDQGVGAGELPNRQYTPGVGGDPGTLVIRRTLTNRGSAPIFDAQLRITSLSQPNGAPPPGRPAPPSPGSLRLVNPLIPSSLITVSDGRTLLVNHLTMDFPAEDPPGGGLSTTLRLPVALNGLPVGGTIHFALTFEVDAPGTFWGSWDVEVVGGGVAPTGATARKRASQSERVRQFSGTLS